MATEEFTASISPAPVEEHEAAWQPAPRRGADLRFLGVVRETEQGLPILGIDYSCYAPMAEKELRAICRTLLRDHEDHRALVHHRVGFVPADVASVPIWKTVRFFDRTN